MKYYCQICKKDDCQIIYESKNDTLARYGFLKNENSPPLATELDQSIAYCSNCSYGWNTCFDYIKIKYDSENIIEAGYFSKRYTDYQRSSAIYLKKIMGFRPNTIIEIGAGAGIFIKEFDAIKKIAIEPSDEAKQIDSSIEVYNEYFSEDKFNIPADIVVLRQVLEHIEDPIEFLKKLERSFSDSDKFYFYIEVPNSTLSFRFGRFYDFYYEHCNYFSINTIYSLARHLNMTIVDLSTEMDGELISVLMTKEKNIPSEIKNKIFINKDSIRNKLNKRLSENKKITAWGASGNGVQILNSLGIKKESIAYVIDSDKNKQGKYIPGTLQKIISPEEAVQHKPDVILVLTQFHKAEIGTACTELFEGSEVWFLN